MEGHQTTHVKTGINGGAQEADYPTNMYNGDMVGSKKKIRVVLPPDSPSLLPKTAKGITFGISKG